MFHSAHLLQQLRKKTSEAPLEVFDLPRPNQVPPEAPPPAMPATPPEVLGPIVHEQVIIGDRTFIIARPEKSDHLLDDPAVRSTFAVDEYLPYWTDLWPVARMLAKTILKEPWTPGLEALEVGCGLGLPGVAALACGLRVTFSDCDSTALRFAGDNALLNGLEDFRLLQMDWRAPPADLKVPVMLASDLTYELRNVEPLVRLIQKVLLPGGLCLLTDQDRPPAHHLREVLTAEGMEFTTHQVRAGQPNGPRVKGTLFRIRMHGT